MKRKKESKIKKFGYRARSTATVVRVLPRVQQLAVLLLSRLPVVVKKPSLSQILAASEAHARRTTACLQEPQSGGTRSIDDDTWRVPVVLVGAGCTGSEATLLDCPGVRLDINIERPQCDITQEVNVVCVNNPSAGV